MSHIDVLPAETARSKISALQDVLIDAVAHGASVGFLHPLSAFNAKIYWEKVLSDVASGSRLLFGALDANGLLVGTAQLALETRANGRHRAEVQKLLVHSSVRKCGLGRALMAKLEREAAAREISLVFLDTSAGAGGAVDFYHRLGYEFVGSIPGYAADPDGTLVANAIFYKLLRPDPVEPAVAASGSHHRPADDACCATNGGGCTRS